MGALCPLQGDGALQLLGHHTDQPQAKGVGGAEVHLLREPAAGVPDPEHKRLFGRRTELDADAPRQLLRERVLETVGQQLVQQEAAGGGGVQADPDVFEFSL
jgi:hypothetical protein